MTPEFIQALLKYLVRCPTNGVQEARELTVLVDRLAASLEKFQSEEKEDDKPVKAVNQ